MNKVKRKFRKLLRDPKLFFSDMYLKHNSKLKKFDTRKHTSQYQYAIISAVYNAEKYLNDYFHSIVNQSLDFEKHIHIICVDDGSTDSSAEIIKSWQQKYPKNITYIYKKNGGQGSARNVGLKHLKADWVDFMDSDDFLDKDYFYHVDMAVTNNAKINLVCCNQIYYFEDKNQYIDRHPLNYRFKTKDNIVPCNDLRKNLQFSAALSFFRVKDIPSDLIFDEELKPTFEDGKFVNTFLLNQKEDSFVYFQPKSRYLNRKRADKSSTMDGVWQHKGQFSTVFERGYLDILSKCQSEKGYIPKHLQRTVLWEMLRLVKQFLNHEERLDFLTINEKEKLLFLMDETFKYIEQDTIMNYELGNCGFSRQLGMLGCFKKLDVNRQVAYIDQVDQKNKLFLLRYFSCFDGDSLITIDDNELIPRFYKKSERKFLSRTFLVEHRLWLPIVDNINGILQINIDGKLTNINYDGKRYHNGLPYEKITTNNVVSSSKKDYLVFMDRDDFAGDNAEFFYEYVQRNHPQLPICFILNKSSPDWVRLKKKGFNLIKHNSKHHLNALKQASALISSQIGGITEPFKDLRREYKIIFLQHGVIKDDLSGWLNNVHMDMMLTSTHQEYNSIARNYSPYIYGEKEIKLTGLPRFDSLYQHKDKFKNQIMVMFTWRKSIAGTFIDNSKSEREFNKQFTETDYYKKINGFFNDPKLAYVNKKYGTEFVFCPHPNMKPYLKLFNLPSYIKAIDDNLRIHDVINDSAMVITDFSSIAFDFAYQNKPVCYYQFDKKAFFSGEHTYTKGYFDYDRDGFGPVYEELENVSRFIITTVNSNYKNQAIYTKRVTNTFKQRDDRNCERVYDEIHKMLHKKHILNNDVEENYLSNRAKKSFNANNWNAVLFRYNHLVKITRSPERRLKYQYRYIKGLIHTGKYSLANDQLTIFEQQVISLNNKYYYKVENLKALLFFYTANFYQAKKLWRNNISTLTNGDLINYARSLFLTGDSLELSKLNVSKLNMNEKRIIELLIYNSDNIDHILLDNLLENNLSNNDKKLLNFDLIQAEICYMKGKNYLAMKKLTEFETYSKDPMRRLLIALVSDQLGNRKKVKKQIEALNEPISLFSQEIFELYYKSVN
ncbi:CDP-glycerol glycerophosphotransferase family protein [Actinobacillus pleuropneumoniae]|uniref:Capsular polysaccharide biosynthesis protein Cps18B n=1 Tax=Actinobacillus pleuropneumoniae serovar 18 TaxID=2138312 RepID=A0A2R4FYC1_ACTPL|nr:CDP-glycerol glycerophosphotransferase family protein [Actinobacillus pleuropneumoniae]AVT42490.1 capsular polysaccharide biosynthesis protein Cps18B [Actinobacillus pleuropneumoniae serovar 18]AVT42501.1 capsular polysaccharide biosynthesis protein Cps18B [Actinobacillus pleuropneumoniae serovar 18]UKH17062.1 glycosyltransferase [Actinobacillus pleuropneumoniae]